MLNRKERIEKFFFHNSQMKGEKTANRMGNNKNQHSKQ
jgi:hypothetical protein